MKNCHFSGWATKANLKCSDGRTILKDAFKNNDGAVVPLVWNHQYNSPDNVLGHAELENRSDGVYAYCTFNNTQSGQEAKKLVENHDITALSIRANKLRHNGSNVVHGNIQEVSLVLAGANPGAFIDSIIAHGETDDEEAVIYTGEDICLYHSSDGGKDNENAADKDVKENKNMADNKKPTTDESEETVADVWNTLSEKQKTVVYALIGQALESKEGDEDMKHNIFDNEDNMSDEVLMHDAMNTIIGDAKRCGSMKESFLSHADEYGIGNIDYLFPDEQSMGNAPDFIKRETGWVQKVMNTVHHTPFSRIKSVFADITEDDARAKGYIKGKFKKDEFFSLLKRTTTPTTIYKKQKMDRDDVIDITDFDVVAWLKTEMRMMLDEEIARAALVGDGRLSSSDDKINESNIRPIWTDADLYTIKYLVDISSSATGSEKAKAFIRAAIKSRKDYKGSGEPTLFTTEDILTDCLLLEDNNGRIIYDSAAKLATTLRVKEIVTVPVMENLSRTDSDGNTRELMGIVVNLSDYNIGADKGGAVNMFDDFDIDYNQQKYLIETRCSGALTKPYSAIALEVKQSKTAGSGS